MAGGDLFGEQLGEACFWSASSVSVLIVGSGGAMSCGSCVGDGCRTDVGERRSFRVGVEGAKGVKADCMASASLICFFLSDWLEAKRTTKKAKSSVMKSA